ncbi:peroxide stress protein YaaA [Baekduia soli]|uniref:Peroxide stress protein YaaA n=1 Tax=Baekduia soli TaxID=496014 RepID=A0A5B8UAD4_9ACTN|nr:peroxide stress protein YaaA [Baekduia soli]QEC50126.1 peroxide stress protein YaaA [Baekduia soli]
MLVLLPPSEGKRAPASGPPVDLEALVHPSLTRKRRAALGALERLARGSRPRALAALGLSPGQGAEVERDAGLLQAPAAPAGEVYTGVLYQHLDLASLPAGAARGAGAEVLVASALWGVVALEDRIPAYRLAMGARLPLRPAPRGGLASWWRPALAAALPDAPGELVLDLRSGVYAAAWRPRAATLVEVRARDEQGRPISHMAKAVRGRVARRVLEAARPPATPAQVAALADDGAGRVALHEPARAGGAWVVEVVGPAAGAAGG